MDDYLASTQRSAVALNTPAVHDCLGWKLGEFFALGKAIVSMPLTRTMPGPLASGEHLIVVDSVEQALEETVRLAADPAARLRLEAAAYRYFQQWLSPSAVIERLLDAAGTSHPALAAV